MSELLRGIDVSHFQQEIDWDQIALSGVKFAFCRASYGVREDTTFVNHFQEAQQAGLFVGAYHFLRFNNRMSAEVQAEAFLDALSSVGGLTQPMLPPVLDLEDNKKFDENVDTAAEKRAYVAMAMKWLEIVEDALGRSAIIYSSKSFFNQLNNPPGFSIRPLWVAHYTTRTSPRIPAQWPRYTFWQYTDDGHVPGISGRVDMNRFDGDVSALKRLTEITQAPVIAADTEDEIENVAVPLGDRGNIRHVIPNALNFRSEPKIKDHTRITSLPLSHPVEILESGINEKWSRVRTLVRGQFIEGFVSERYLREPLSPSKETLIAEAVKEWLRFRRGDGKENQSPFVSYVGEMWQALNRNLDGNDTRFYWSAAFISFIVKNAGEEYGDFKMSARHSTYIHDAIVKKERNENAPFWGYRLKEKTPQLGDMIAQWRVSARTYDQAKEQKKFSSHVDVIVRLTDTHAITIGGNVSNSVSMREKYYKLDSRGFLKPVKNTFALLHNRTG